jgi:hypothetical protein
MLKRLHWFFHGFIGHPVAAVLELFGLERAAIIVHDATLPRNS